MINVHMCIMYAHSNVKFNDDVIVESAPTIMSLTDSLRVITYKGC